MRIFKYWTSITTEIIIGDQKQESKVYGGSNQSIKEAFEDAKRRLLQVPKLINGEIQREQDYEADIIEEIFDQIDDNNIVTRNRYGALVLNSKNIMFIDVDIESFLLWIRYLEEANQKKK